MALLVNPNGNYAAKGTHVSVYAVILKGAYDFQLKWPFTGMFCFTLLNQLEDKNHYTERVAVDAAFKAEVGSGKGLAAFIPHDNLVHDPGRNICYLKDDSLHFKVSVQPANPWLECKQIHKALQASVTELYRTKMLGRAASLRN